MAFDLQVFLELVDNLTGPLGRPMQALQNMERQVNRVEQGTQQMLDGAAVAAAGAAVVAPLVMAANAASDLSEATSKSTVVFKENQATITAWARNSARDYGLSKQAAIENAATLGNLFVSMKIGSNSAALMSTRLVSLAGDLASFNNTSVQDAYDALRSGLVGETEPLRRFGVNMDEQSLKLKAFQLGLTKKVKVDTLPPAVKAMAAYALIFDQTKTAQGDFARTQAGLANSTRILQAQMGDAWANIGRFVLPTATRLVGLASGLLSRFNAFATDHPFVAKALTLTAVAIGAVLLVGGTLLVLLGALNVAWGSAVGGVALLRGGLAATTGWLRATALGYYQNAVAVGAWTTANSTAHWMNLKQLGGLGALRLALIGTKVQLIGAATAAWGFAAALLANPVTWVVVGVVALLAVLWKLWKVFPQIAQVVSKTVGRVLYWLGFLAGVVTGVFVNAFKGAVRAIWYTLAGLWDIVAGTVSLIVGLFTGDLDQVRAGAQRVMGGVVQVFQHTLGWLLTLPGKLLKLGQQMVTGLWRGLVWLFTLPQRLTILGLQLMLGLVKGIWKGAKQVWATTKTVASGMLTRFKTFFGIRSPSRVFSGLGEDLMNGLTKGLEKKAPAVLSFLRDKLGPRILSTLQTGWNRLKAGGGQLWQGVQGFFGAGGSGGPAVNGPATAARFDPGTIAGNDTGAKLARAAVQGITAGWAESMPGYCSRFTRQVFQKALGPQTAKLFGSSALNTERIWKSQGLTKTLAEIGGKAALKAGDILFQGFGSGGYGHTAMYLGNGKIAHNSTMGKGGKMISDLSSFGTITSVGRIPTAPAPRTSPGAPTVPAPPRPKPTTAAPGKAPITVQNVHLPNVSTPDEFVTGLRRLAEAHQ